MIATYLQETERLRLRELSSEDAVFIVELLNTPGWLKYIGERNVKSEEQAKCYLFNGPIKSYRENGFGLWLVELKETQKPIGMCGILRRDYLEHPDIGFAFLPDFNGKGFAFEAAQSSLFYAKWILQHNTICAITLPGNEHSIKLLMKLGLSYIQPIHLPLTGEEVLLYRN